MIDQIDFEKGNGLVPAIIQDASTRAVLMLGYMNREALEKTQREGRVTFYSRSKKRLWTKGETSGHHLEVVDIRPDCDKDALLIKARPAGPVCHRGSDTCFFEKNKDPEFLNTLEKVIAERKAHPSDKSYTSSLLARGVPKVAQKVGEEAVELVIEALAEQNEKRFLSEAADLIYHLLVLLAARDHRLADVVAVLEARHR